MTYTGISKLFIVVFLNFNCGRDILSSTEKYSMKMSPPSGESLWRRINLSIWFSITPNMTFWYIPYILGDVSRLSQYITHLQQVIHHYSQILRIQILSVVL